MLENSIENRVKALEEAIISLKNQMIEGQDQYQNNLTAKNFIEYMTTYVYNESESLDSLNDFYMDFKIISEMTEILEVKVSFKIKNYRAYSTAASSGGGSTSGSGGGFSTTSGDNSRGHIHGIGLSGTDIGSGTDYPVYCRYITSSSQYVLWINNGTGKKQVQSTDSPSMDHTHSVIIPSHTHSIPNHTHDISYGIHEESNSPTINFYISEDDGASYSDVFGPYLTSQDDIEITTLLTDAGNKMLKFTATELCRLSVSIVCKLKVKAR
ncbi:MAG: hypothetical protein ACOWWR_18510 [Eubacteriales bacterium]